MDAKQRLMNGDAEGCLSVLAQEMPCSAPESDQLLTRAVAHLRLGEFGEALADCDQLLRYDADNRHLYHVRGVACRKMHRYPDAIANLNQALDIKADFGAALLERAACFVEMGRQSEAEQDLRRALMLVETALQGFADSMGMMRTAFDGVQALQTGERDYPRLIIPAAEAEALLQTVH